MKLSCNVRSQTLVNIISRLFFYVNLMIQAVEMSYSRNACCVRRMDVENNESVYNRFGMSSKGEEMKCRVVEGVKHNILTYFGHIEKKKKAESGMAKRM